jgi:hypothetical protein
MREGLVPWARSVSFENDSGLNRRRLDRFLASNRRLGVALSLFTDLAGRSPDTNRYSHAYHEGLENIAVVTRCK